MTTQEIYEDYRPNESIFNNETDDIIKLKKIIFNKLSEAERRIIILYAQEESLRKLGALLGISTASAWIEVNRIRKKIKGYYYGE